jgi:Na+-transporting NADH:ubiquinone oxidoreductase subunit NqrB
MHDARILQILFLGTLLAAGAWLRDFSLRPSQVLLTFFAGIATQVLCARTRGLKRIGIPSAVITCLSLSILLRADTLWAHPLLAASAIGSKFLIRVRGKHVFNPGNLGIILGLLLVPGTWTSPGQWGQDLAFAGWFVALGTIVTCRARRGDISWAFLAFYLGLLAARVAWLGQSLAVFVHQIGNGSLLLFAFFMISDPMTIPNHPRGRIVHAALVAGLAAIWQFGLYRPNGLIFALFLLAPAVALWDRLWPAPKFTWQHNASQGGTHGPMFAIRPRPDIPARPAGTAGLDSLVPGNIASRR